MSHTITIANQKGGVGKTTTTINLATGLAAADKRVLIIDFDPQANASTGLGLTKQKRVMNIYGILVGHYTVSQALVKTLIPGLSIIPSAIDLLGAEIELVDMKERESCLKEIIAPYKSMFDYILIDCPPSMGLLTLNAMVASDSVLIPLQCEYYALEGLSYLLGSIQKIKKNFNQKLDLFGVILTMFDRRSSLCQMVAEDVKKFLGDKVFQTAVPRNTKVSEAPSHGKPVLIYDLKCPGSKAYMAIARELLTRDANRIQAA
ncbi:ParA family protein [Candidatus Paracaedibacter symbiosus]|uniref:ParA family protein n=1 Tax=Candidatus Paracaedibacter symbiosus TaxID=244582 RepID=UPI000509DBF9|nr:ParA family protein [Candidatus Paracaedibacter symbiosus]